MAANGAVNILIYKEAWMERLQMELDEANKWEDICRVEYTSDRVIHNPYITDPSVHIVARGTPYTFDPVVRTDESVTINTGYAIPQFIDRADLAQTGYKEQMELAVRQAVLLKEQIEGDVYGTHASFTDFGAGDVNGTSTGDATQITVSETNIDNIILAVQKTIEVANGQALLERNGGFFVWRPADFLFLKQYAMAAGFVSADNALRGGIKGGFDYMGFTHYTSNLLKANHVFAGVKKLLHLAILNTTYGDVVIDDKDPNLQSGISIVTRADYAVKVWTKIKPVLLDINVS